MLGLAALRAAGSGLESGYSRGRACPISGSDTLSRKKSVSELSPVYETYKGDRQTGEMTHMSLITHLENIDSRKIEQYLLQGGIHGFMKRAGALRLRTPIFHCRTF